MTETWKPLNNPNDTALTPWQKLGTTVQDGLVDKKQGNFKQSPPFTWTGTLSTGSGAPRWTSPEDGTIVEIRATVNTAPTGAAIKVDVNKNGTTIFTTQANRPTIAVSTFTITAIPDNPTITAGDYFQVDIDQVGSTIAGADLVVQITYQTPGLGSNTLSTASDLTVMEADASPTVSSVRTISVTNGKLTDNGSGSISLDLSGSAGLIIKEVDGAPSGTPSTLKFPNGTLTDNGDGSYTYTAAASGITIEEEDGSPSASGVTTIKVPNGSLVDNGGGSYSWSMAASIIVQEGDVTVDSAVTTIDFQSGFDVTSSPAGEANVSLDLSEAATGGDLTWSGNTPTVANDAVTFAKMQNITTARLLGRNTAGTGDVEQISLGTNLSFSGTTLNASGGGGSVATDTIWDTKGDLAAATGADAASKLAVGSNGQVLTADSTQATGIKWAAAASGSVATDTIFDAKGDLPVGTGADTAAKLTVGSNGQMVAADSSQSTGLKWVTPATDLAGSGVAKVIVKPGDESVTSSTALQDDDDLQFAIGASETWCGKCVLFTDGATGGDLKATIIGPTSATGVVSVWGPGTAETTFDTQHSQNQVAALAAAPSVGTLGSGNKTVVYVDFAVFNSTNTGSIKLQWAQNASSGTATKVYKGSYLHAWRTA